MVWTCTVVGCTNRNNNTVGKSFYQLPTVKDRDDAAVKELTLRRRQQWITNINRADWKPSKWTKVCTDHFISGSPSSLEDINHRDWAPTLNLGYAVLKLSTSDDANGDESDKQVETEFDGPGPSKLTKSPTKNSRKKINTPRKSTEQQERDDGEPSSEQRLVSAPPEEPTANRKKLQDVLPRSLFRNDEASSSKSPPYRGVSKLENGRVTKTRKTGKGQYERAIMEYKKINVKFTNNGQAGGGGDGDDYGEEESSPELNMDESGMAMVSRNVRQFDIVKYERRVNLLAEENENLRNANENLKQEVVGLKDLDRTRCEQIARLFKETERLKKEGKSTYCTVS